MAVDATTQTELEKPVITWRVLAFMDFVGDPLRATSGLYEMTIAGETDDELNGTYTSLPQELVNVGAVTHAEDGADTVSISLSGLIAGNTDLLNTIGTKSNWQGRTARLWFYLVDENETLVSEYIPYYTGYMDSVSLSGTPESQTIEVTIENWLATLAGASAKTYLIQSDYDSGDTSAAASIAAANGLIEGVISGGGGAGGGGGQGGPGRFDRRSKF